jgi:PAS domain S-box-containing protein
LKPVFLFLVFCQLFQLPLLAQNRETRRAEVSAGISPSSPGVIAAIASRVLSSEKLRHIPIFRSAYSQTFDWQTPDHSRLENSVSLGSAVLGGWPGFWQAYKRHIVAGFIALLAETFLIVSLLLERRKRKKSAAEVLRADAQRRLAMESGRCVGWEWDLVRGEITWFGDLRTMFGIAPETFSGKIGAFFDYVHPEDRKQVAEAVADERQNHKRYSAEFRVVRLDGCTRWVRSQGTFEYAKNGEAKRMLGIAIDITDQRLIRQNLRDSQSRLEGIVESAMDAIIAIDDEMRIVLFNAAAEKMFGTPAKEALGVRMERFIPQRFAAGHQRHVLRYSDTGVTNRAMGGLGSLWAVRANGQEFPIEVSISQVEVGGKKLFTAIVRDITEQKRAEQSLRESEERFRLVADTAPVLIWMAGLDKLCTYFNGPWLTFTGRSLQQELGNGWADGVHPDDLAECWKNYETNFDKREEFQMEYRLRRHDGEYRWIFDHGMPRFNSDGSFAGYIGSCTDITERRSAQEALSAMSRKLIEAHEQERTWLARELHDDVNQEIALLAVNLDRLRQELPPLSASGGARFEGICRRVVELGSDIHALSHRLHSSKLEYLGIAAAASSFCRELSEKHQVQTDFQSEAIPEKLPKEVALCLFRVLQEALQNAIKHSGTQRFEVFLEGRPNSIELTVRDWGIGFDPVKALERPGLGLTSMNERLKLVDGDFSIDSPDGGGTLVRATVPLTISSRAAGA